MPEIQLPNVYGDPDESPARQLWIATKAWHRMMQRELEPLGLTHAQYLLLASLDYLCQREETVTLRRLCRFAPMDENMASQVVKSLIEKGWVLKSDHPTDRRSQRLEPSEPGRAKVAEALLVSRPANAAFFEPLGSRAAELAGMLLTLTGGEADEDELGHPRL